MSNQKKRQQARLQEAEFEKVVTKRDKEIMDVLYGAIADHKMPKDKVKMMHFYSGVKWADENPADTTKMQYTFLGAAIGFFTGGIIAAIISFLI